MKKLKLNLKGAKALNKAEQRRINGGYVGNVCKATCNDGTLQGTDICDNKANACSSNGGAKSCKCDYPSPLDPPGGY